jgi:anti-anti-sigma factor
MSNTDDQPAVTRYRAGPGLTTAVAADTGRFIMTLAGDLDILAESRLDAVLRELIDRAAVSGVGEVRVDLHDVAVCDAAGLRVLIRAWHAARDRDVVFTLANPRPRVRSILHVTRVATLFSSERSPSTTGAG